MKSPHNRLNNRQLLPLSLQSTDTWPGTWCPSIYIHSCKTCLCVNWRIADKSSPKWKAVVFLLVFDKPQLELPGRASKKTLWGFNRKRHLSTAKKPLVFRVFFRRWNTSQLCGDQNKPLIRIPKHPVYWKVRSVFFPGSPRPPPSHTGRWCWDWVMRFQARSGFETVQGQKGNSGSATATTGCPLDGRCWDQRWG